MSVNKRKLKHYWGYVRDVKPWELLIVFLVLLGFSILALRANSKGLVSRVEAVVEADQANEGIDEALSNLDAYISAHMNTHLDEPVQLAYSYDRAAQKVLDQTEGSAQRGIYREAQRVCEDPNVLLSVRALCIQDYVINNAASGREPKPIEFPDKELYTYSYDPPDWSPDLAGFLVLLTWLAGILLFSRTLAGWLVDRTLRKD